MSVLYNAMADYVRHRRALGFKFSQQASVLRDFVSFLDREGAPYITTELALRWARIRRNAQPTRWAQRLSMARGLARYCNSIDPRNEIPPSGLLPYRPQRRIPYIYTDKEICRLIQSAKELPSDSGLRSQTYSTLFGLLAVTGLRISEVIALNCEHVDLKQGVLTIEKTKFTKTRLVPVHVSTERVLKRYRNRCKRIYPKSMSPSFFLSEYGTRLNDCTVRSTFVKLSHQIGLRGKSDSDGPRLHDLRHTFAVKTLVNWYRKDLDVERQMPLLSTYLGHTHVADTYWYLSAVPELLALARARLERTR